MKNIPLHVLSGICALVVSCGGKISGGGDDATTAWVLDSPLVDKVEVLCGENPVQTFQYTYDDSGRLQTLLKTDAQTGDVLLELSYSYPSQTQMKVAGKFFPISTNRFITAEYSAADACVTYSGSWASAWDYTVSFDSAGTASSTVSDMDFAASEGWYSSKTSYLEEYTIEDGCITRADFLTQVGSTSARRSGSRNASTLSVSYSYNSSPDRQNFAAYLFQCTFPVWYAAGLPGCKRLVSDISYSSAGVDMPQRSHIEYSLDASGNIQTATRTDYNASEPELVLTYKFYYK